MKKELEYYLNLNYPISIEAIPEDEGGGFIASIPQLGKYSFVGDGMTVEEAYQNLKKIKKEIFEEYLKKGIQIPEPIVEPDENDFSGKFIIRIPRTLHKNLAESASNEGVSLNQYIVHLLSSNYIVDFLKKKDDKSVVYQLPDARYSVVSDNKGK